MTLHTLTFNSIHLNSIRHASLAWMMTDYSPQNCIKVNWLDSIISICSRFIERVCMWVCVCDCASPPQLFTLLSLCVCVRVWECVCMCVTSRLWTQGGAVRPVLITRPPCAPCWCCCHPDVTVVGVKKAWRCVCEYMCVCVWIPGGLVFPLPLRDGSAPVWGTLIWTGPPLCDGTNHSTPRSLKPIIFLFKAGRAREAKRGEDGPCKKLPILSLEHGKNGLLARNRLMLNDPLRL